jgi:glycerophosphoryl diester phosphodiesterase
LTKDDKVVIWHDEYIDPTKCRDTGAVKPDDPVYPYVGKYIANL